VAATTTARRRQNGAVAGHSEEHGDWGVE